MVMDNKSCSKISRIMSYTGIHDVISSHLVLIDFEKAFDSKQWSFFYIKFFGFGEYIIQWIKF